MLVISKGKLNFPTLSGEPGDRGIVRRPQGSVEWQQAGDSRFMRHGAVTSLVGDFQAELRGGQEVVQAEETSHCFSLLCGTVRAAERTHKWLPQRFLSLKRN